jgi:hypothetical protein
MAPQLVMVYFFALADSGFCVNRRFERQYQPTNRREAADLNRSALSMTLTVD